jgi:hypothetical protein
VKAFIERHKSFVTTIYTIAFYLGTIWGFIQVLRIIFDSLRTGNFFGFVIAILFNSIIAMLNGLVFAALYGTIAVVVLFIPYLVIRGLFK